MPPSPHVIKHNQSQRPLPPSLCDYVIYVQPLNAFSSILHCYKCVQSTYKVHVLIAHLEFMWQAASPDSRIISSSYSFGNVALAGRGH